jgi:ABC-2 type transport system permease protein
MINVISSEFYKIFKSKVFYVISAILLGMNMLYLVSVFKQKLNSSSGVNEQMLETGISGYQSFYSADGFLYIILIFVAFLITAEYANGSIRQMACHGIARWKLVLGQYIAMFSVITIMLLGFGILNLLSTTILFQLGEVDGAVFIRMNIGMLCMFWGMSGIGAFLSYLFKNGGIAIAISFLTILGGNFIVGLLNLLTKSDIFSMYSLTNMRKTIVNFASKPEDVMKCSIVFFLIGIATILCSSLVFSKRDVD